MLANRFVPAVLALFLSFYLAGCGGGTQSTGSQPTGPQPISVAISASTPTVDGVSGDTVALTATVANDRAGGGVSWSLTGGGTISGSATSATYTPPSAGKSPVTATVTATSVADSTKTATVTITVPAAATVSTGSITAGAVGTAYSTTMAASGGISPYTWSITSGTLPAGLTMSSSGAITGTPMAGGAGTSNLTFKVIDSGMPNPLTTTADLSLTVAAAPPVTFGNGSLADGTLNVAYSGAISATGGTGTLTYTVASGAFPGGIAISSSGVLSGTPAKVGNFSATVKASDAYGDWATQVYTLKINDSTLTVSAVTPSVGYVGSTYTPATLAATGGSGIGYTWAVSNGSALPAGLLLSTAGVITGKPTTAGNLTTSVTVTDSASNTATGSLSFTIKPGISITTPTPLPTASTESAYSQTFAAIGGSGSGYTWAVANGSTLPGGLTLSSSGVLSGKPTAAATSNFTVTVTDSASNTASATFTITINPAITIGVLTLPKGLQNTAYPGVTFTATGGTGSGYSWTWAAAAGSSLPAGLTLSTAGAVSGTPTVSGTFSIVVTVIDSESDNASQTFSLAIEPALAVTAITPPVGYVGSNYPQTTLTATGGSGTGYTWAVSNGSSLPAGLVLSSGGVVTGNPATAGNVTTRVTVTDSQSHTATASLSFAIKASISIITGTTLPPGYAGSAYSQTLAASGGSGSGYTWAVATGSTLPGGLTLSSVGVLSGRLTAAATSSFTITVTDLASNSASATFSLTVNPGITFGSITLPKGLQGTAYPGVTLMATGGSGSGYSWTWAAASGSSLPVGLALSTAGVISGTPTGSGSFSVAVTVTDSASNTASQTLPLIVEPTLSIATAATLKPGTVNIPYSVTLAATGGSGTYSAWTVTQGANQIQTLGLSLSSAGILSGTPTVAGTATFTAQVTDSENHTATASLTVSTYSALTITTASLPAGNVGTAYTQTLIAAGGTGIGYTWSATNSNLATYGLSLSAAGEISGTPTTAGTASFTPAVKDSSNSTATAGAPLTITVYAALTLPTTNPASLPGTGTTGVAYTGSVSAAGGSGNFSWTITGMPSDGLNASTTGATVNVTGTPSAAATVSFTAAVKDNTTGVSVGPYTYTIAISNAGPLRFATGTTLPPGTVSQGYTESIVASGGVGPYTWAINGTNIPGTGSVQPLSNGLTVSTTGTLTLNIGGAPTAVGTVTFTATITDSLGSSVGPTTFTIQVNPAASQVSGQVQLVNPCGTNISVPPVSVSLNTSPVQTVTTDNNGNYSFPSVPNGTYTITPSISGPSSLFTPASISNVVVNNGSMTGENFAVSLGYSVSGNVNYTGTNTGTIYVSVNSSQCGNRLGTSISSPGVFTIRGVPPGSYTLEAYMDTLGFGYPDGADPDGHTNNFSVTTANVTNASVTTSDPGSYVITKGPGINAISSMDSGVVIGFSPILGSNPNGVTVELPTYYTVQWSTDANFSNPAPQSYTFPAGGANGTGVWFLSNDTKNMTGSFANGTVYHFRARGSVGSSQGPWTVYGGATPAGVTIGASTGANTVTGTITFSATPTGPLAVGFFDQSTGLVYATRIASPISPQAYTVKVPTGSNYFFFAVLDQNNDGMIDPGDVSNLRGNNLAAVSISGNTTMNLALNPPDSTAAVTNSYKQLTSGSTTTSNYSLNFQVRESVKLPVAVTLASGPGVIKPVDMNNCMDCGTPQFQYSAMLAPGVTPSVGDAYGLSVRYSDGTTETLNASVTGVLGAGALATLISPEGNGVSNTPNFDWSYPASAANYSYQFSVCCGTNGNIWQIPGQNSKASGFTNSQIVPPLVWGADPTDSTNAPDSSSLSAGTHYSWSIQSQDSNGNSAQAQTQFSTAGAGLNLPSGNPSTLPPAVVNTPYTGTITAIGGIPPYGWYVAGLPDDNLTVSSSDICGCIVISGTPNNVTTPGNPITIQVTLVDSTGASYGPVTYTIAVSSYTQISLPAAGGNPLGSALVGAGYSGSITATGGSGGSNYSFVVNGTAIPTNNTYTAIANGGGLSAANSGSNTLMFGGTPAAAGTITLTVEVIDMTNLSDTASVTYTISVISSPGGANNSRLSGTYSCITQGFNDSDGARWATVSNMVADGNGNFSSGVWDTNGRDLSTPASGTITGTYSVGSDNEGIASTTMGSTNAAWAIALTGSGTVAQTFRMVETDDAGSSPSGKHAQALCYLDTTSAFAAGTVEGNTFAFGIQGEDNSGVPDAFVGRFSASGGSINTGYLDGMKLSQTGDNGGALAGSLGATVDTNGRLSMTLTTSNGNMNFIVYIVDANRMFLLEDDAANGMLSGEMRRQQNTGNYSAAGLNGGAILFSQGMLYSSTSSGFSNDHASLVMQVTGAGDGNLTINQSYQDENSNGTATSSNNVANGAVMPVTFDSSNVGRATFSPGSDKAFLYFFNTNNAFLLELNGSQGWLQTGWMQPQTVSTFSNGSVSGTYLMGQMPRLQPSSDSSMGWVTLSGTGVLTGGISTAGVGSFSYDQSISGTYTWDSTTYGGFVVPGIGGNSGSRCVVATNTNTICTEETGGVPSVMIFQQ